MVPAKLVESASYVKTVTILDKTASRVDDDGGSFPLNEFSKVK